MLLTMFLFQKWLGSSFPEDVWSLSVVTLDALTPCEALPSVWIGFAWQYSQACGHPCCLCTFFYPTSSFQLTLHLICFDTALLEQPPPLSVMPLCDLLLWGVSMIVHCQVSSVPHYCGFREQEITTIYTVWMVIYWNSNVKKYFLYFTCNESKIYESFTLWNKLQYKKNSPYSFFFLDVPVYVFLEFVFILFCSLFFVKRKRFKTKLKKNIKTNLF